MPEYNSEKYLDAAIQSILKQTFKEFEFIIIDDGSTDKSITVIQKYLNDKRIRFIKNKKNIGLVKSLNKGIRLSKGEYIARMDGDDISEPQRLEKQVKFLDMHPEIGLLGTQGIVINEKGEKIKDFSRQTSDLNLRIKIMEGNPFIHGSVMMRKSDLLRTDMYDPKYVRAEDYGLWLDFIKICKVANLPDILYQWRSYGESRADNEELMRKQEECFALIQEKLRKSNKYLLEKSLYRLSRIYCFLKKKYENCTHKYNR